MQYDSFLTIFVTPNYSQLLFKSKEILSDHSIPIIPAFGKFHQKLIHNKLIKSQKLLIIVMNKSHFT